MNAKSQEFRTLCNLDFHDTEFNKPFEYEPGYLAFTEEPQRESYERLKVWHQVEYTKHARELAAMHWKGPAHDL
jgi:hypothetical protein